MPTWTYELLLTAVKPGDRIAHSTPFHTSTGVVSVVSSDGAFYRLENDPNSYGWVRVGYDDEILVLETNEDIEGIDMSTLEDLQKSISEMSDEELQARINESRTARRAGPQKKKAMKKKKEGAKQVKQVTEGLDALIAGMTPEQKAALLKQLG